MENSSYLPEAQALQEVRQHDNYVKIDRAFGWLMIGQWVFGILAAVVISPYTWIGEAKQVHLHVWASVLLGGLICLFPFYLSRRQAGDFLTRHVMAVAQLLYSSLLIHLMGGRIEAHFHIFGSLAFLAYYRDAKVIYTASVVTVLDHLIRGYIYPLSVYGVLNASEWRWLEHTAWVIFEDVFLLIAIKNGLHEIKKSTMYEAALIKERERALNLSKIKTRFLSNMSHEIRTPLNSIVGYSDLLGQTPLNPEQQQYIGTIHRCTESLLGVVNDVLDISRIESGRLTVEKGAFDIRELQSTLQGIFAVQCEKKKIQLRVITEGDWPPMVTGDRHRLQQVLVNLLGNAVKFTQEGSVHLHLRRDGDCAIWSVSDTGIGIRPENQELVFGPFTQEDASTARKFGGSGLGLTISRALVEQMGGELKMQSTPGVGSVFEFSVKVIE
ncbi:hypothetical protein AZI86_17960 [Bdellovibrio bacteriovorus]|uniref:histidine kinase n=1 Tax=Bdellovibrio bacteriovorus TaxID=959 RepID=A0A150WEY2_BDEBC|nr:ATP-binding protein [Bdellovibrio bacteriovorus]KYG61589.1 hypothetical protein AZI86_17960 [Bdellovibrio bacteriovorus]